jgi:hypothetical protein
MYLVTVEALVPREQMNVDDRNEMIAGTYLIGEKDEEAALNYFHDHIAIACLDDFEIIAEEINTTDPRIDDATDL